MTDRIDKRDKHQPPALIKARPNATTPDDIQAFDKDRFEALLQGASSTPDAIPEQRPLAQSPLIPRSDAAPAGEGRAGQGQQDEVESGTARSLADAFESPRQQDHPAGTAEAVPGKAQPEAQGQEPDGIPAGPGALATPASLDPQLLNMRRKRKLQMEMKMHEDAAKTMAQEQVAARPAQQLPPPPGTVAGGKAPPASRIEGVGAIAKADIAPRTAPASPSPSPDMPDMPDIPNVPDTPENEALSPAPEHDEGTRQHRHHQSERQETVAAEAGAAQVVQEQILALRNMPESLPLHLLESI